MKDDLLKLFSQKKKTMAVCGLFSSFFVLFISQKYSLLEYDYRVSFLKFYIVLILLNIAETCILHHNEDEEVPLRVKILFIAIGAPVWLLWLFILEFIKITLLL